MIAPADSKFHIARLPTATSFQSNKNLLPFLVAPKCSQIELLLPSYLTTQPSHCIEAFHSMEGWQQEPISSLQIQSRVCTNCFVEKNSILQNLHSPNYPHQLCTHPNPTQIENELSIQVISISTHPSWSKEKLFEGSFVPRMVNTDKMSLSEIQQPIVVLTRQECKPWKNIYLLSLLLQGRLK